MPSFWSYITNGKYSVGCTGQTVYLYDNTGAELAKFKDLIYVYTAAFSPKGDIFVVKTTDGRLGVYSADERRLIKKFRFSKVDGSQDDIFCFSHDGEWFYNIERHGVSYNSALSIYRTGDFSLDRRLYMDESICLDAIENDKETDDYYILGFDRSDDDNAYFVAEMCCDKLMFKEPITEREFDFYQGYKNLEFKGFTKKAKEWSSLVYDGYDLSGIENSGYSLAKLWQYYHEKRLGNT